MHGGGGRNPNAYQAGYAITHIIQRKGIKKTKTDWKIVSNEPLPRSRKLSYSPQTVMAYGPDSINNDII